MPKPRVKDKKVKHGNALRISTLKLIEEFVKENNIPVRQTFIEECILERIKQLKESREYK